MVKPANRSIVIDTVRYKAMLLKIIIPFLTEANSKARSENNQAYLKIINFLPYIIPESFRLESSVTNKLESLMLEVYQEQMSTKSFDKIVHIDFSGFNQKVQDAFESSPYIKLNGVSYSFNDVFVNSNNKNPVNNPEYMFVSQGMPIEYLVKNELKLSSGIKSLYKSIINRFSVLLHNPLVNQSFTGNLFGLSKDGFVELGHQDKRRLHEVPIPKSSLLFTENSRSQSLRPLSLSKLAEKNTNFNDVLIFSKVSPQPVNRQVKTTQNQNNQNHN